MENRNLSYSCEGLIPAIIQDEATGQVLMLAYMNEEALKKTRETGHTWFWSRSRQKLWKKGETSGHTQKVKEIRYDCDADTLLVLVEPAGPACHTGNKSCFYRSLSENNAAATCWRKDDFLPELSEVISSRLREKPPGSYVARLAKAGGDKIIQKVGEEATELVIALKNKNREEVIYEAADLIFHTLLALEWSEVPWHGILQELKSRHLGKK